MVYCSECKYFVGPLSTCSLANEVYDGSRECLDYEQKRYTSSTKCAYSDAIVSMKLVGSERFYNLPRAVRGFFPNRYLIAVVKDMAVFHLPWEQDRCDTRARIGKIDISLQAFIKVGAFQQDKQHSTLVFVARKKGTSEGHQEQQILLESLGLSFNSVDYIM